MKLKNNQSGAAHIVVILLVILIAVVGVVGWKVWDNNKNKSNNTSSITNNSSQSSSNDNSSSVDKKAYLEIPELGVKITLSEEIEDAYYVIVKKDSRTTASISTKSLDNISKNCSASEDYFGGIYYFTDPNAPDPYAGASTNAEAFPDALLISDKYIYLATNHQDSCLGSDWSEEKSASLVKVRDAFDQAKLEKI